MVIHNIKMKHFKYQNHTYTWFALHLSSQEKKYRSEKIPQELLVKSTQGRCVEKTEGITKEEINVLTSYCNRH